MLIVLFQVKISCDTEQKKK